MEISMVKRHFSFYKQFVEIHWFGDVRIVVYYILLCKDKNRTI